MPTFSFDGSKSIDKNFKDFFEHLKSADAEFGKYLEEKLPSAVDGTFSRQVFNRGVETMLDTSPKSQEGEV